MSEDIEKRIADLERRIKELEVQPREQHFHYHHPVYQPPYQAPPPLTLEPVTPQRIYIGDPPSWGPTTNPWIPNSAGTVTWDGGQH